MEGRGLQFPSPVVYPMLCISGSLTFMLTPTSLGLFEIPQLWLHSFILHFNLLAHQYLRSCFRKNLTFCTPLLPSFCSLLWVFLDSVRHKAKASVSLLRLQKSTGWHVAQSSLWLSILCGLKYLQLATSLIASNFCCLLLLLPNSF